MGEITSTKWFCDRCKAQYDKRPAKIYPEHTVTASQHNEWAGGRIIDWRELCPTCEREVEKGLRALMVIHHSKHGYTND